MCDCAQGQTYRMKHWHDELLQSFEEVSSANFASKLGPKNVINLRSCSNLNQVQGVFERYLTPVDKTCQVNFKSRKFF